MANDAIGGDEKRDTLAESGGSATESVKKHHKSNSILLVPYPKFIFMYPTLIVATLAAIVMYFGGYHTVDPDTQNLPVVMTGLFLVVMMANMFVIVFDFPRATSLTLVFVLATVAMGVWMLTLLKPDLLPAIGHLFSGLRPAANTTFFVCTSLAMILMYIAVFVSVRFDYWELRNNELLHHHGFLSDLKRYPAPNLRVDKEINDVFEFLLLGAGRLILHPTTEKRAIVLDNILFVGKKERELTRVLGSIKVQIGSDSSGSN
ncbi:putative membrane protein [Rhodopirellula maiorica SM1]|uniref:Putative membrane protein n=1 Tax=Rhodopirellula maiorica SM1 TaxID=1265738 RepID=M5RL47_9BACT|nr:hypothetical protein [Rhodopirellula maiorica]EMI19906.1 putative membrane protein [Rhodopirellula maiorica SM1]